MQEVTTKPIGSSAPHRLTDYANSNGTHREVKRLISVVAPAYNESSILQDNLSQLCDYLTTLENQYDWELVVVNDGSRDDTGYLAERFAETESRVRVVHHRVNQGLGQALRTAFDAAEGEYIVVVDLDLSYSPDHIGRLLDRIEETNAAMVVASPYMPGGSIGNVPWLRKVMSVWANKFLSFASKRSLATLTGMVRVYDAEFLRLLNLRSRGMEINPEIVHKALLLMSQIEEIPGHLHWRNPLPNPAPASPRGKKAKKRSSSMKILRHTYDVLFSGFLFRPVVFFLFPSLFMFGLSAYSNFWVIWHCFNQYSLLAAAGNAAMDLAVARAFSVAPHAFFIGGMTLMLAIQLFSLGILSAQNKSYFEELFYLGSANSRRQRKSDARLGRHR
jgi:glycosyltransferase involved in cell wall biosynthesis